MRRALSRSCLNGLSIGFSPVLALILAGASGGLRFVGCVIKSFEWIKLPSSMNADPTL
jgi:hypothetical protein